MKRLNLNAVLFAIITAVFFITPPAMAQSDSLYVDPNGNVGVGTDSPASKFHVGSGEVRFPSETASPTLFHSASDGNNYIRGVTTLSDRVGVKKVPASTINLDVTGYVRGLAFLAYSDFTLKQNISTVTNSLDHLSKLRGVKYQLIDDPNNSQTYYLGVIAQEVEQEFPELVMTDEDGYKSVDYQGLIAPLIESVKLLKAENESHLVRIQTLEAENKSLEARIAALEKAIQ